jgi:hypothetical protein
MVGGSSSMDIAQESPRSMMSLDTASSISSMSMTEHEKMKHTVLMKCQHLLNSLSSGVFLEARKEWCLSFVSQWCELRDNVQKAAPDYPIGSPVHLTYLDLLVDNINAISQDLQRKMENINGSPEPSRRQIEVGSMSISMETVLQEICGLLQVVQKLILQSPISKYWENVKVVPQSQAPPSSALDSLAFLASAVDYLESV